MLYRPSRFALKLDLHDFGDALEIRPLHLKHATPEGIAPLLFVLDEAQRLDQRTDRRCLTFEESNAPPPRVKTRSHLYLIRLFVGHTADSSKSLKRLSTSKLRAG